jgi:hypothetical protein
MGAPSTTATAFSISARRVLVNLSTSLLRRRSLPRLGGANDASAGCHDATNGLHGWSSRSMRSSTAANRRSISTRTSESGKAERRRSTLGRARSAAIVCSINRSSSLCCGSQISSKTALVMSQDVGIPASTDAPAPNKTAALADIALQRTCGTVRTRTLDLPCPRRDSKVRDEAREARRGVARRSPVTGAHARARRARRLPGARDGR